MTGERGSDGSVREGVTVRDALVRGSDKSVREGMMGQSESV